MIDNSRGSEGLKGIEVNELTSNRGLTRWLTLWWTLLYTDVTLAIRRYYGIEAVKVVGNVTDMAMDNVHWTIGHGLCI